MRYKRGLLGLCPLPAKRTIVLEIKRRNETCPPPNSKEEEGEGDGFDQPSHQRTTIDHRRASRTALPSSREHMRIQSVSGGPSSVCLNECWKGMDMATAACATLGERDIILNGTVLTAAIRCIPCTECYALPAVPMNSVDDCNEQREERVQEGIAGPRLVRSDLICDHNSTQFR